MAKLRQYPLGKVQEYQMSWGETLVTTSKSEGNVVYIEGYKRGGVFLLTSWVKPLSVAEEMRVIFQLRKDGLKSRIDSYTF